METQVTAPPAFAPPASTNAEASAPEAETPALPPAHSKASSYLDEGDWRDEAPISSRNLFIKALTSSRYLFLVAVLSTYIATLVLLARGAVDTVLMVAASLGLYESAVSDSVHAQALKIVDTFLVAAVLYVLATGFYQIFVRTNLPLPYWMRIRHCLKSKVPV